MPRPDIPGTLDSSTLVLPLDEKKPPLGTAFSAAEAHLIKLVAGAGFEPTTFRL